MHTLLMTICILTLVTGVASIVLAVILRRKLGKFIEVMTPLSPKARLEVQLYRLCRNLSTEVSDPASPYRGTIPTMFLNVDGCTIEVTKSDRFQGGVFQRPVFNVEVGEKVVTFSFAERRATVAPVDDLPALLRNLLSGNQVITIPNPEQEQLIQRMRAKAVLN